MTTARPGRRRGLDSMREQVLGAAPRLSPAGVMTYAARGPASHCAPGRRPVPGCGRPRPVTGAAG